MPIAHERLPGLDRERLLAAVEPVLRAHRVDGVELVWRTDGQGWVLELTLERPEAQTPGAGITVDLCSEVSRDLSAALDAHDVIPCAYRLMVGSPGLDRALYQADDYRRFAGQLARVKLRRPRADGQRVLRGVLQGLSEVPGEVLIATERGEESVPLADVESARLVFEFGAAERRPGQARGAARASSGRAPERSRRAMKSR